MVADPLSDALALVDTRCVITGGFAAGGAWALNFWPVARLKLSAVVAGSCWLAVDGVAEPVRLAEGDVAVFNDRTSVVLASDLSLPPVDSRPLFGADRETVVRIGDTAHGGPADLVLVGGHVDLNRGGEDLLLAALPPFTHLRAGSAQAPALRWLLDRLHGEMTTGAPGAGAAAHQLAQLLFVEVLRAYLADAGSFPPGWLRTLADERLAPALRLMHANPARSWHLDELARSAAMSRTTFAARFKSVAGVPPLTYLHHWRMRIAERALREDDTPIATLAPSLGYTSESAFSNAFKRTVGVAPKRYRDAART